jgi:uncharacterized membrane protein YoaK (UPF0700 family)
MSAVRCSRLTQVSVIAVLLAACAGSVDAFAFFGLGHAFAGIVTGNLVTAGYGLATGNASLVKPAAVNAAAGGSLAKIGVSIRQLCALIAGAALAGILLRDLRSAVPALPLVLLTAATTIQAWCPSPAHHRDQPSGENAS